MTAGSATTCIVVGAGLSGLLAATRLQEEGWQVTVVDKARGVGGRMATRRFEGGVFDHGAQFFTVRDARFAELVEMWQQAGVVEEWSRGFAMPNRTRTFDGHPRYRGIPGMTGMPKHLASGLDLRLQTRVASVHPTDDAWVVSIEDGSELQAHALIMTAPVPQALAMLAAGAVDLPETIRQALDRIDYDPCFAVMALLEGPSAIPVPGAIQMNSEPIAWIADNAHKGVSATPGAVTIHAGPEFSRAHI
ncbi:MAG: NAD(P)-binding protein, partial [Chloroflexi bacterium]|nr:NAD(P)-binding protein [Chloroflexota bacterium]